eukprot:343660-Chlamydomonas_euryale.AAC.12
MLRWCLLLQGWQVPAAAKWRTLLRPTLAGVFAAAHAAAATAPAPAAQAAVAAAATAHLPASSATAAISAAALSHASSALHAQPAAAAVAVAVAPFVASPAPAAPAAAASSAMPRACSGRRGLHQAPRPPTTALHIQDHRCSQALHQAARGRCPGCRRCRCASL